MCPRVVQWTGASRRRPRTWRSLTGSARTASPSPSCAPPLSPLLSLCLLPATIPAKASGADWTLVNQQSLSPLLPIRPGFPGCFPQVFTKVDKKRKVRPGKRTNAMENVEKFQFELGQTWAEFPPMVLTSSSAMIGKQARVAEAPLRLQQGELSLRMLVRRFALWLFGDRRALRLVRCPYRMCRVVSAQELGNHIAFLRNRWKKGGVRRAVAAPTGPTGGAKGGAGAGKGGAAEKQDAGNPEDC